jgi:predicted RNase H-like nuclease (RuvC/YqgF family)
MKIIYTLRGNNYNDDIEYNFNNEIITTKYKHNAKLKPRLEKKLAHLKNELSETETKLSMATEVDKKQALQTAVSKIKNNISQFETKISTLDMTVEEDTADLSVVEEGDRLENVESTLPVGPIVDVKREDGELFVKLAHMPLPVNERIELLGDKTYRVNVMEYEVV